MPQSLLRALLLLAATISTAAAQTGPNAFSFVGFGDVPYSLPGDYAKVDKLISVINREKPAFAIHVGDIKSGSTPCTDEILKKAIDQINTVEVPVVYSIGDNEWVDCHRAKAGRFNPRERLAAMRALAFAKPGTTLGKATMQVESQAVVMREKFAKYVENQRFIKNGVVFIVPHVPGSNNGFEAIDPEAAAEYFARNAANIAWIDDGFRIARESGAKAAVIAFQANPFDIRQGEPELPPASGFVDTINAIERGARAFAKPVLVMFGDEHVLEIKNFRNSKLEPIPNVWQLQLMGEKRVHAVKIVVDPDSPGVFAFVPLIVPENGPF